MQNWPHNSKYFLSAQEAESSRQPGAIKVFQYQTFTDTEASKRNTQCSYSFVKQLGAIYTHHRKRINIRRKNNILKTGLNGTETADCGNTGNLLILGQNRDSYFFSEQRRTSAIKCDVFVCEKEGERKKNHKN